MRRSAHGALRLNGWGLWLAGLAALPAPVWAQSAPPSTGTGTQPSPMGDDAAIGDIVVTALKRETILQRTPDAITALNGDALASKGADRLADLTSAVPNLSFSSNFGISQIFIRGIGNNFYTPGGDPGVAFYNDGAYVSDQEATDVALFDVERVEVLRGPQGALYGRNATGGAINVISAAPTGTFNGQIGVVVGDYGRIEGTGFLSGPLGFASTNARLSVEIKRNSGFTRNELAGRPGALPRFDDLKSVALRAQTSTMIGAANLHLTGFYLRERDNGPAEKVLPDPSPQPAELLFGVRPSADKRSLKSNFGGNYRKVYGGLATFKAQIGSTEFTLLGSYRHSQHELSYDQDGTEADQSTTRLVTTSRDISVDARLASTGRRRFDWLIGATYVDFRQNRVTYVFDAIPLGFVAPGAPLNIPFPVNFSAGGEVRSTSIAGYADGHFSITDKLKLSGGIRYTSDKKAADEFVNFLGIQNATPSDRWSRASGKIGLDYQASDGLLLYASAARGFKSGAINLGALTNPVRPETVDNFEAGLKSNFLDRRAQLNIAAFTSNYRDLQVLQIGALTQILSNAAKARISGLEIEGVLKPVAGLTLTGNVSVLDAKYREFVTDDIRHGQLAVDVSGNRLPLTSKVQFSLGAEYAARIGRFVLTPGVNYAYRSSYYFSEFNTADARQRGYGLLDFSLTLEPGDKRFRVYAFVRNATDRNVIGSMAIVSPLLGSVRIVNLLPPRTFGIGANVNF